MSVGMAEGQNPKPESANRTGEHPKPGRSGYLPNRQSAIGDQQFN